MKNTYWCKFSGVIGLYATLTPAAVFLGVLGLKSRASSIPSMCIAAERLPSPFLSTSKHV